MKIYNYHPVTKEFLSESTADKSPLEPGVFLIPANAARIIPPEIGENQTAVFENNEWVIKPDFRGKAGFHKETKEEITITEIGELPEYFTEAQPADYSNWNAELNQWEIDPEKEKAIFNTQLEFEMITIETEKANSRAIREAVLALANGQPVSDVVLNKLQEIERLISPIRDKYKK